MEVICPECGYEGYWTEWCGAESEAGCPKCGFHGYLIKDGTDKKELDK